MCSHTRVLGALFFAVAAAGCLAAPPLSVRVQSRGPALVAVVAAGPSDPGLFVIGYKPCGVLTAALHVNAYMKIRFDVVRRAGSRVPHEFVVERSIPIGRAPNGGGFLSRALTLEDLFDLDPGHGDQFYPTRVKSIELAYFIHGRWDSNFDRNYAFAVPELLSTGCAYACSGTPEADGLPPDAWAFVIGLMAN